jgi:hypothetical protein
MRELFSRLRDKCLCGHPCWMHFALEDSCSGEDCDCIFFESARKFGSKRVGEALRKDDERK